MPETTDLVIVAPKPPSEAPLSVFGSMAGFESAQRIAKALASSDLLPDTYKNNIGNCLIALEVAARTGASILAVTQSLNIIHGRPSWSSAWIIGAVNTSGRFASELRFDRSGTGDERGCIAWAVGKDGQRVEGPPITIAMSKKEGWFQKNGSKWQSLPDLMLMYRAASFFGRLYASDLLLGLHAAEEAEDLEPVNVTPPKLVAPPMLDKVPAGADVGVHASSPLAVGAGQTGETMTVEVTTPAATDEKQKRGRKPKADAPRAADEQARMQTEPGDASKPLVGASVPPRIRPVELF